MEIIFLYYEAREIHMVHVLLLMLPGQLAIQLKGFTLGDLRKEYTRHSVHI